MDILLRRKNVIVEQGAPGGRIQTFREKLMFFYVGTKCHCNVKHKIKGQTVTAFGRPNLIRVEVSLSDELSYFLCQNVLFYGDIQYNPSILNVSQQLDRWMDAMIGSKCHEGGS
jgi:hypothetical protein